MVWLVNRWHKRGCNPKFLLKFVESCQITEPFPNPTYLVKQLGQSSIRNGCHLQLYRPCNTQLGWAPATIEPRRRPNMRGIVQGPCTNNICNLTIPHMNLDRPTPTSTSNNTDQYPKLYNEQQPSNSGNWGTRSGEHGSIHQQINRPKRITKRPVQFPLHECLVINNDVIEPTTRRYHQLNTRYVWSNAEQALSIQVSRFYRAETECITHPCPI